MHLLRYFAFAKVFVALSLRMYLRVNGGICGGIHESNGICGANVQPSKPAKQIVVPPRAAPYIANGIITIVLTREIVT